MHKEVSVITFWQFDNMLKELGYPKVLRLSVNDYEVIRSKFRDWQFRSFDDEGYEYLQISDTRVMPWPQKIPTRPDITDLSEVEHGWF